MPLLHQHVVRTLVLGDYLAPLSDMVRQFKYRQQVHLGAALVQVHATHLLSSHSFGAIPIPAWPDCILPVPLHADRLRTRGYNQSAILARHYGKALRVPVNLKTMVRIDSSPTRQVNRTRRERLRAGSAQFSVTRPLPGQRLLLVDDVMTTGTTLDSATRALLNAGASSVVRIVVARTP
jgi:ComF family protein